MELSKADGGTSAVIGSAMRDGKGGEKFHHVP